MTCVLSVDHLSVNRGGTVIVKGASLAVHAGEIVGLIGPNGAGKSTLIGGVLGFYPLQAGTVTIGSRTFGPGEALPAEIKRQVAYIPEQPMYWPDLTLAEHLEWKMRLWDLTSPGKGFRQRLPELITRFQLEPHMNKFPHQCSKGTLQKLMAVQAFLFPFDLLVVDEPFIGMDVIAIRRLKELFEQARREGAAILLSTHVLDSAERICDRFAFMDEGEVFAAGSLAELRRDDRAEAATLEDLFLALLEERNAARDTAL